MKIVVYTALYGDIDKLWSVCPMAYDPNAEWFAFMDKECQQIGLWGEQSPRIIDSGAAFPVWVPIILEPQWSNRRTARHYKTMPHLYFPKADVWIWLDANVRLLISPTEAVERWLKGDLAIFKHPDRNDAYTEAHFCAKVGKDDPKILEQQMKRYEREQFPVAFGLPETRCVLRRNTESMRKMNELWWYEIDHNSCRDQVSIPYVCWKLGLKWDIIPGRCWVRNEHKQFYFVKHHV